MPSAGEGGTATASPTPTTSNKTKWTNRALTGQQGQSFFGTRAAFNLLWMPEWRSELILSIVSRSDNSKGDAFRKRSPGKDRLLVQLLRLESLRVAHGDPTHVDDHKPGKKKEKKLHCEVPRW